MTMGLLNYLKKQYGIKNPGEVTWSHAVNNVKKLNSSLNNPDIMVIESDIRLSSNGTPVAAHPPETESDLTYAELIKKMKQSKKALKLDFKDPEILEPCLQILQEEKLTQPILLNADILQGNGANPPNFNPSEFLKTCNKYYPEGILSIGWTTTANAKLGYTNDNIDEMTKLTSKLDEVIIPVRACLLPNSWAQLARLLSNPKYSISVWNNESVDDDLATWIKENTDPQRTYYDFIDENKNPLKLW